MICLHLHSTIHLICSILTDFGWLPCLNYYRRNNCWDRHTKFDYGDGPSGGNCAEWQAARANPFEVPAYSLVGACADAPCFYFLSDPSLAGPAEHDYPP